MGRWQWKAAGNCLSLPNRSQGRGGETSDPAITLPLSVRSGDSRTLTVPGRGLPGLEFRVGSSVGFEW